MDGLLRAYLIGPAAMPEGGQATVVLVEPNGDEHQVLCACKPGGATQISYQGEVAEYLNNRYGDSTVCSVVRRAALGLSRRPTADLDGGGEALRNLFVTQRSTEAFEFARKAHERQVRKGTGIPYLSHLLNVAGIVLDYGGDEDEMIAGLLHDVPEDAGGEEALVDIRRMFGERVASIVQGCSDTMELPKPPWKDRKALHLARLAGADYSTLLVFAADKLHNSRSINADLRRHGGAVWDHFKAGKDGSLWYYRAAVEMLTAHPETTGDLKELSVLLGEAVTSLEDWI